MGKGYKRIFEDDDIRAAKYCYDWRESAVVEAARLHAFMLMVKQDETLSKEGINIVTHSFGGLLVLLLLGDTTEFDSIINSITFVAPPFGGTLNSLQVIEHGDGTYDTLEWFVDLKELTSTYPSTFQSMPAPKEFWIDELPCASGSSRSGSSEPGSPKSASSSKSETCVKLHYPLRGKTKTLFDLGSYTNRSNWELRSDLLNHAYDTHKLLHEYRTTVAQRLNDKIHVLVQMNGKTPYGAIDLSPVEGVLRHLKGWVLNSFTGHPPPDTFMNGDGVVVFQSSFLPGLDVDRHLAIIPNEISYMHASIMENDSIIGGIKAILRGEDPTKVLTCYSDFIDKVHWGPEETELKDDDPNYTDMDYMQRNRLRKVVDEEKWDELSLNRMDDSHNITDSELYNKTHSSAERVLRGENIDAVATETKVSKKYIERHLLKMVTPLKE